MKVMLQIVEGGNYPVEVLKIDQGQEEVVGTMTELDESVEVEIEHPAAIVVRPVQQ